MISQKTDYDTFGKTITDADAFEGHVEFAHEKLVEHDVRLEILERQVDRLIKIVVELKAESE